ncbi:MAG TPA: MFS transporter [Acidimicrobiales bacterium]|nr:MFS transporter [Acidimicrobiales bacterium]
MRRRLAGRRRGGRPPLPPGFATIWTTVALDLVGFGIILPVLPLYAERFGARPATIGVLLASFSVAQLLFAPVWGSVSDRIVRKPVLVLSLVGTALGSLLTGLAGSLPLLFLGRIVDGMSGASVSVAQASVGDLAPPAERARLFGLLGAAFGVGFVAGPALGALAALGGRRLPFLLAAGVAGLNAIAAARRLPETHAGRGGRDVDVDVDEAARAAVAPESMSPGQPSVATAGSGLTRLLVVAFFSLVAFSAFEATFALFGEKRLSFGPASTGVVFTAVGLVLVVVQTTLVRPMVARLGEPTTLRVALLVNGCGLALLAVVHSWLVLVPALVALVVGQGLAQPSITSAVSGRARRGQRGRALGFQQSAGGLARVVGPVAGGLAFQHVGAGSPFLAGAVVMVLCAVAVRK